MYTNFKTDIERGYDCVKITRSKGEEVVKHFTTYDEAWKYASQHKGMVVRYYSTIK